MNEEFAIKLKMIMDQSSIASVKQQLGEVKDMAEKAMGEAVSPATNFTDSFNTEEVKAYSAQIELLVDKIEELSWQVDAMHEHPELWDRRMILEAEAELERLKNKLYDLTHDSGSGMSVFSKTTVMIKNNLKGIKRSIMGIIGGLIGARGIYTSIRKAMSAYLAQNDELRAKLNGCWYALGSLFAPVLEWIINKFVYLVSLVDALVKSLGLAGVNMSKYGKAGAKASKQTAGFDEINNISSQGGGGLGDAFKLNEVTEEALNKFKTILALVTAIGAGLMAWKVASTINDLFELGWNPVQLGGIALAVGGITLAIMGLFNYLNDPSWANFGEIIGGIGLAILGVGMFIGSTPMIVAGAIIAILGLIAPFWEQISSFLDNVVEYVESHMGSLKEWLTVWFGGVGTIVGNMIDVIWEIVKGMIRGIQNLLTGLFNGAKQILDGIIQIFRGDFKGGITNVLQGLVTIGKGVLNSGIAIVNGFLSAISKGINYMIDGINSIHFTVPSWVPWVGGSSVGFNINHVGTWQIPSLDVGTNYVPNDQLAMVHKGEAVIPKAFNEDQYNNSEETNDLLRELIDVVGSKEFRAYISQSEIGKSAVKYINQQSRIQGGSII